MEEHTEVLGSVDDAGNVYVSGEDFARAWNEGADALLLLLSDGLFGENDVLLSGFANDVALLGSLRASEFAPVTLKAMYELARRLNSVMAETAIVHRLSQYGPGPREAFGMLMHLTEHPLVVEDPIGELADDDGDSDPHVGRAA